MDGEPRSRPITIPHRGRREAENQLEKHALVTHCPTRRREALRPRWPPSSHSVSVVLARWRHRPLCTALGLRNCVSPVFWGPPLPFLLRNLQY